VCPLSEQVSEENLQSVRIKDYFCDSLDFTFSFRVEDFDKDAFLEDTKTEAKDFYAWSFGSVQHKGEQHAHMRLQFDGDESVLLISYHASDAKIEDIRPPYMEDCAQWIFQFFKVDELDVKLNGTFIFKETHTPILSLPFPLVTENKSLAGSTISGLSIELPKEEALRRVLVQMLDKTDTLIIGFTRKKIKLKTFNLRTQLSRISATVMKLMRKKEGAS